VRITVALIVKNEERTLARCLSSLAGAGVEILVVDTGSTDSTVEIARRFTDRVHHFAWCDDFAAARQHAFDLVEADWVMWLDADDVVHGAERLRGLAASAAAGVSGFQLRYVYEQDEWGAPVCELWRERLVRRDAGFRWRGRVHEVLVCDGPHRLARSGEVYVEHRPERSRAAEKSGRNLRILEDEYRRLLEAGRRPGSRLLFYLANELLGAGRERRALALYRECLRESVWDEERYFVRTRVAAVHRRAGRWGRAVESDLGALRVCPERPEAYFGLAESYYHLGDWAKVRHWCEVGRAVRAHDVDLFVNPRANSFDWIILYTNALYRLGDVRAALDWTRRALELRPADAWHRANFLFFAGELAKDAEGGRSLEEGHYAVPPATGVAPAGGGLAPDHDRLDNGGAFPLHPGAREALAATSTEATT